MEFDYRKFLTENRLTTTSRLMQEKEEEVDDEAEPSKKDVDTGDAKVSALGSKQRKLQSLVKQKDAILAKFKSGEITIDQYKREIGDIPRQIKDLQADVEKEMSTDDSEEEA